MTIESGELSKRVVKIQQQGQLLLGLTVPKQTVSVQYEAVEPQEIPYCSEEKDIPGDKNGNKAMWSFHFREQYVTQHNMDGAHNII